MIGDVEQFYTYLTLALVGLCMGSFAGALAWRLRAHQLASDRADHEEYDKDEYRQLKKLTKSKIFSDRSQCLHCDYQLKWYDLIPVFSWVVLRGKCRNCRSPIGYLEPLIEIGVMALFILSFAFWPLTLTNPLEVARLVIWLVAGVCLAVLAVYDGKWFLLPDEINYTLIGLGLISSALVLLGSSDIAVSLAGITGSIIILSGVYFVLYLISRGRWIGLGDIKLGLGLALLLADWQLAFVALFAANIIGCLWVIPGMVAGKLKRDSHVPFGPLLIVGSIASQIAGPYLVGLYMSWLL